MADLMLKRTPHGLAPTDETSQRYMNALKMGQVVRATVKIPRNGYHHRLVFALLSMTYQNLPEKYAEVWRSFDHFRKAIALEAGHVELVARMDGEVVAIPGSLSFDALDQPAFEAVSGKMLAVCAQILDMEAPELAAEVEKHTDMREVA